MILSAGTMAGVSGYVAGYVALPWHLLPTGTRLLAIPVN
jgi:hypothetical protein